jgi:hypothetical protein
VAILRADLSGYLRKPPTGFRGTVGSHRAFPLRTYSGNIMRSVLLWFIGIPIPIIILLWLVTGHA